MTSALESDKMQSSEDMGRGEYFSIDFLDSTIILIWNGYYITIVNRTP